MEKRSILMPTHVSQLIKHGHKVTVEKSVKRAVPIEQFEEVDGVRIAEEGEWIDAPIDAVIMGIKALPEEPVSLVHTHMYFAHCYKGQYGHEEILGRFAEGEGKLYDLEFLEKDRKRIASFGEAAGNAGVALAVLCYIWNKSHPDLVRKGRGYPSIAGWSSDTAESLAEEVLEAANKFNVQMPVIHVIGALGQVGSGARRMIHLLNFPDEKVKLWDLQETKRNVGPYEELLQSDIFVNCINLKKKGMVFLTQEIIEKPDRKLSIIADISCDYKNPANPLPIYSQGTSFEKPTMRLIEGNNPLDIIAIDSIPTIIPVESSKLFGDQLLPHLLEFEETRVWHDALDLFYKKIRETKPKNLEY